MENRRVTCFIAAYRKFEYIYQAIDSVLSQTYSDIELIICDDGSENFPEDELREYIEAHKRDNIKRCLVYSNEENLGTIRNVNTAIRKATGNYFIPLAADDRFFDETVMEKVVKAFDETGALVASCRAYMCATGGNMDGTCFQTDDNIREMQTLSPERLFDRIARENIITGASRYFTAEALQKYGYFNERYKYIEDIPHFLTIFKQGGRVAFFDIPAIWWRRDGISGSGSRPLRYIEDELAIVQNEILAHRNKLSRLTYRYNLCRQASLMCRLEHSGNIPFRKKLEIAIRYPDAVCYRIYASIRLRFLKRKRIAIDNYAQS